MSKINPFAPNSPVHPGMFVGRVAELIKLESSLVQTRAGNPSHFMITGERGIGKSSILNYIKHVARGMEGLEDTKVSFLVVDTDIDPNTTQLGLIKKIELGLNRALGKTETARVFLNSCWDFLQRVEVKGVKVRPDDRSESEELLLEEFSYSLADIVERVCSGDAPSLFAAHFDGIIFLGHLLPEWVISA